MREHNVLMRPGEMAVLSAMQNILSSNLDYPFEWIVAHAKAAGVDVVVVTDTDGLPMVQLAPRVEQPPAPVDEALASYMEEFQVPAFAPPPAEPAKYVWWSWSPVYPKWAQSCWGGTTIEAAEARIEGAHCAELRCYHNKLIKHENGTLVEVRDRPCRDPEILNGWRFYKKAHEKRKEGDESWT